MEPAKSVDEILDFAISKEQEAVDFYTGLAQKMTKPHMIKLFQDFVEVEKHHKDKLLGVKQGGRLRPSPQKIMDLKIAELLVNVEPAEVTDYQDALTLAMKREKEAFTLYTRLAEAAEEPDLKDTFLALAQEEAKHKLYLEVEYDEHVLGDN
ncbi:MAG: ferritin family protein [Desulfarculaceae bacterium]|jgi:rubrerythrin